MTLIIISRLMNIRSILLLCALILLPLTASAQWFSPRIEGGFSFSGERLSSVGHSYSGSREVTYRVGGALEIKLGSHFYLAPGLALRGGKARYDLSGITPLGLLASVLDDDASRVGESATLTTNALVLPVSLGLRLPLTRTIGLSIEGGVHISYALQEDFSASLGRLIAEVRAMERVDIRRYGYGINASAALELWSLYLRGGIEVGLNDRLNAKQVEVKDQESLKVTNTSAYLTLGIRL